MNARAYTRTEEYPHQPREKPHVWAKPFVWRDPSTLPQRQHVYGKHYTRRFMGTTVAPSGGGKSGLVRVEAAAMASGKALLGVQPAGRSRVWLWNGEDPSEEADRGLAALAIRYGLVASDLEGFLFTGSGRDADLVVAEQTRSGAIVCAPVVAAITAMIRELQIDVVIIDPFISSHRVTENDNPAIDLVAKAWCRIAEATNVAVELVHHARKTNGAEFTVEDGRGAVALLAASRSARVLNSMTKEEGERAGIDRPASYFRVDNGKSNLAPAADGCTWHKFESVSLGNGGIDGGDSIGVVTPWKWPDAFDGVTAVHLFEVQKLIDAGSYRADPQSPSWAGMAVAEVLGLDLTDKGSRAKAKRLLDRWELDGLFVKEQRLDEKSKPRPHLVVGRWAGL